MPATNPGRTALLWRNVLLHIVVIGTGQAAVALVARLRCDGFDGDITLIGEEAVLPYERPPLSKGLLLGDVGMDGILLRPATWYGEHNIALKTGLRVIDIDPVAQAVMLQNGERIAYDKLALCTGATPRRLPQALGGNLSGVYSIRTIVDTERLAIELVAGRRVLIVGGGYIGLEAAAVAAGKGLNVTIVEMAPRILQRVACPETSAYFAALHEKNGVRILEATGLSKLVGEDRIVGAELVDGSFLPADFAIVGIGVLPATDLARRAGVAVSNGIDTDAQGRTNVDNIWAAGDCANLNYRGERLRIECVGNAIDRAETVARSMLGHGVEAISTPWFWSDQYDCRLQIAGLGVGYDAIHVKIFLNRPDARVHWYFRQGRLIACDAMNAPKDYMIGKRLIEAGKSPDPDVLCNEGTDLRWLLRN